MMTVLSEQVVMNGTGGRENIELLSPVVNIQKVYASLKNYVNILLYDKVLLLLSVIDIIEG